VTVPYVFLYTISPLLKSKLLASFVYSRSLPHFLWALSTWSDRFTYTIGAYHHWCCGFDSRPGRGVQHYVIKFSPGAPDSSNNKTDRHDITEILFKVALNIIKQTNKHQVKKKNNSFRHGPFKLPYRYANLHVVVIRRSV